MKIGIELNGIVRNLNKQIIKYYKKDIDKTFDDKSVDYNVLDVSNELNMTKKERYNYMYVDYPYEIFGCAKAMETHLPTTINSWVKILGDEGIDLAFFSTMEEGLTIQSTYFFLSKIGSRVREMFFPTDGAEMWNECDVIITTNKRVVESKPEGKIVILIKRSDNTNLESKADYVFDSLMQVLTDGDLIGKAKECSNTKTKDNLFTKIKKYFTR